MESENRPDAPETDLPAGYDPRVVVVRDPLPLAELRSFPLRSHHHGHRALLIDGGGEAVLASSRGKWLFLWIVDLERRTVAERVSLRAPDDLRDCLSISQHRDRLWVKGSEGVLGVSRRDWRILAWRPYSKRVPVPEDIHDTFLVPGSSHLWVSLGDSNCIFDLRSGGMASPRDAVGWPLPLPHPGGPLVVTLGDDRHRCRLHRPDGARADDAEAPVMEGVFSVAAAPNGRGLVEMALIDRDDQHLNADLRLRWLEPRPGLGYRAAAEHEIRDVAELEHFHSMAASFDAGLCFVLADCGGRQNLHALSVGAGGFRERYRLALPYTAELIQDPASWSVAALFSDEQGLRILPLGPEPPPERFPETLSSPPRFGFPALDGPLSFPRFADVATETDYWGVYAMMQWRSDGARRELFQLFETEERDKPDELVSVGYALASLAEIERREPRRRAVLEGLLARLCDLLAEVHPRHARAALFLAGQEAHAGRWRSVLRRLEAVRQGELDGHPLCHFFHLSGLALLHEGRVDEAHAAFEQAARYEWRGLDVEYLRQMTQPMSDPPEPAEWGPDQGLVRRLLGAIRTADRARRAGDVAAVRTALDRPWVWEASETQSFARFADMVLDLPASTPAKRFDKRLVLAHFCKVATRGSRGRPRAEIQLPGVSWEAAGIDRIEERAAAWLTEEAGEGSG